MIPNPEDLINALGALCEVAGFLYTNLIKNGFPEERAYELAGEYIMQTLFAASQKEEDYELE